VISEHRLKIFPPFNLEGSAPWRKRHAEKAVTVFAERLGLPECPAPDVRGPAFANPLLVHVAALLALRGTHPTNEIRDSSGQELLAWIIDREQERWLAARAGYGLDARLEPDTALRIIAAVTMLAPSLADVVPLLAVMPELADLPLRERVRDWLREVLPGEDSVPPLRPDLAVEELLSRITDLGDLAVKLCRDARCSLPYQQHMVETLTLAATGPDSATGSDVVGRALRQLLDAHPELRIRSADGSEEAEPTSFRDEGDIEIIELRHEVTRFGSAEPEERPRGDFGHFNLDSPVAAPWHFTIIKKGGLLDLRTRSFGHGPYIDGEAIAGASLQPGDYFDFGSRRYTVLDASHLQAAPLGRCDLVAAGLFARAGSSVRLSEVSFALRERQLLAVLGPAGSGKSSLLGALLGEVPLTSGRMFFRGLPLATHAAQIRDQIGFVPATTDLPGSLTVSAILRSSARLRGIRLGQEHAVDRALQLTMLDFQRDQLFSTLSGSQQRRVSVAVELLASPPLLLVDDPVSGLDTAAAERIILILRAYAAEGHTVIITTDVTEHLHLADQVLVITRDGPVYFGPPRSLRKHLGFRTNAELMNLLFERSREWAESYHHGGPDRDAAREADSLAQQISAPPTPVNSSKAFGRSEPWRSGHRLRTLLIREQALFLGRGQTRSPRDRNWLYRLKNAMVLGMPFILIAAGAALVAALSDPNALSQIGPHRSSVSASLSLTLLVALSLLSGQMISFSNIIDNTPLIRRDHRAGTSALIVVLSKWLAFLPVAGLQALAISLSYLAIQPAPRQSGTVAPALELIAELACMTVAAMSLGLLISATARRLEQAFILTAVSITQIALAGVLLPRIPEVPAANITSMLLPARWGFAAIASSIGLHNSSPAGHPDALWHHTSSQWIADMSMLFVLTGTYLVLAAWLLARQVGARTPTWRSRKR
jgi:ABC-type multidrug transport system ATPase subunit